MKNLNTIMAGTTLNVAVENQNVAGGIFTAMFSVASTKSLSARIAAIFSEKDKKHVNVASGVLRAWTDVNTYMSVGDLVVFRPPRMSVSYVEYLNALIGALDVVRNIEAEFFKPMTLVVSALINDPSVLLNRSTSVHRLAKVPLLDKNPEVHIEEIKKCTTDASGSDKMKYREAFLNNAQLLEATVLCDKLNGYVTEFKPARVAKLTADLFELASILAEQVEVLGTEEKVNNLPAINELSKMFFDAAHWIELAGTVTHASIVVTTALNDTAAKIQKMQKK